MLLKFDNKAKNLTRLSCFR